MTNLRRALVQAGLLLTAALGVAPAYWAALNMLGPSTEYLNPYVEGATRLPDGKFEAYVGDVVFVRYTVVRHKTNGDCLLDVGRYGELVGGPDRGRRIMLDHAELRFRGADERLHPRWPLDGLRLTDAFIPVGRDSQEIALYVVARYHCNPLDAVFPRYLQGGLSANETARTSLIIRRRP